MDDWLVCLLETDETCQRYAPANISIVEFDDEEASASNSSSNEANTVKPNSRKDAEFTLYYYPHCFYSQKIMMILVQKNLKFHQHLININSGEQFHIDFSLINPKCEVPVLLDKDKKLHLIDSKVIAKYLEDKYLHDQPRCMIPLEDSLASIHEQFYNMINNINIEILTYGSTQFPKDQLRIEHPKEPYNLHHIREQMRETMTTRTALLRTEALKLEHSNPEAHAAILEKIHGVHRELHIIKDLDQYNTFLEQVEDVLNKCEVQLAVQFEKNPDHWLITSYITFADVVLSLLLFRLWQLGYEKRMLKDGSHPNLVKYFERVQHVPSFQKATGADDDQLAHWPFYAAAASFILGIFVIFWGWKSEKPVALKSMND